MSLGQYSFIFVTESWLTDHVTNAMIDPLHHYHILRRDRTSKTGGGVCALISQVFKIVEHVFNEDEKSLMDHCECEILCFDVLLPNARQRFILAYRPPPTSTKKELLLAKTQSFISLLSKLVDSRVTTFILGDLNLPKIYWESMSSVIDGIHNAVFDYLCSHGFSQFVTEPTRLNNNLSYNHEDSQGNILDVILSTDPLSINVDRLLAPIGSSDHSQIEFSIFFPFYDNSSTELPPRVDFHDGVQISDLKLPIPDWANANFETLNNVLVTYDWDSFFQYNLDANVLWDNFKAVVLPMIHMFVPMKMVSSSRKYKVRQYPKVIRKLIIKKRAIWHQLKIKNNLELKMKYRTVMNDCNLEIQRFDMDRERKMLDSNNIGAFYKFINNKLSSKSGVAPLKSRNGKILCTDDEKANLLNEYFESVFTIDNGSLPSFPYRLSGESVLKEDIEINPKIVEKILKKMKTNSSAGPDGLPPIFLQVNRYEHHFSALHHV